MAESSPFRQKDNAPFFVFLLLSTFIVAGASVSGYWIRFPELKAPEPPAIELTNVEDVEKLGDPDAPEEIPPPPEPEPTPPPEPEPTPPPLEEPPEFEIPDPSPTPTPAATPAASPKPQPPPKPQPEKKPGETPNPNAAATPGVAKGSKTGAPDGTGTGGPRSGTLVRCPKPAYPQQALRMGIKGDVRVAFTVQNGSIVDAKAVSGHPMLSSYVVRHCKATWKFAPGTNGTFTLPVQFQIR
jgi:TonB family protein